jgi:60 kDa SS-A/Ro ribonucleoprotein
MSNSLKTYSTKRTSQSDRARADQVKNNAGGFGFTVTPKARLERFLVLGTDGGTYYVGEKKYTADNAKFVIDLAFTDPDLLIDTTVAISKAGRAYRNSPAIFAVAAAVSFVPETHKAKARAAVQQVCRTSTHLFEFAQYIENLSGWGRAKRKAVAEWYESKTAEQLAYQTIKYRQRDGWTHKDLLRLSHARPDSDVANFILGKSYANSPDIVQGFIEMQSAQNVQQVLSVLRDYKNLPWETIPTEFLTSDAVWRMLYENGAIGGIALLRNTTRFAKSGMFKDTVFRRDFAKTINDPEWIAKNRVHPLQYLLAMKQYNAATDWQRLSKISDGLESGFYGAFKTIQPSNKPTLLAIDVSGSMRWSNVVGIKNLTAAEGAALMAMATARVEPDYEIRGFSHEFKDLHISKNDSLGTVLSKTNDANFGGTDCALPMMWAMQAGLPFEMFAVYTDSETWYGKIHPYQALQQFRRKMQVPAKLAVVAMTSTEFTIADPNDAGSLDCAGFDANTPSVIADFARQ